MAENAERTKDLHDLEDAMLANLENSIIHEASRFAAIYIAVIDGISPSITALISLAPFFLVKIGIFDFGVAIKTSVALTLLTIFMIGVFLGKVSGENVLEKGLLMTAAGVFTVLLTAIISIIF
jgi:predicted membrane protein (TIGR00267 family)